MAIKKPQPKEPGLKLKQLNFLIGKWHTEGEILKSSSYPSIPIRGMDTYEWINNGFFILHRVDVFMGTERTEAIEIIGYDEIRKSYLLKSFDNRGESLTMYARLIKPGILKLEEKMMRSTLSTANRGNYMIAKWERSENGKTWIPWMELKLSK